MLKQSTGPRTCRVCRSPFSPARSTQIVCGLACAKRIPVLARKQEKAEKKKTRARIDELRPLSYWLKLAQHEINRYVRLRDAALECVSCGRPPNWDGQWHASHFRSVGAASTVRFHLWNVHKACSICNNWKSGNLSEYEPRLRARIGDERVEWLRIQNQLTRYRAEYLKRLTAVYREKTRRLAKFRAAIA